MRWAGVQCLRVSAHPSSRARGTWDKRCSPRSPWGASRRALATSVTYAKERFTFGRAIGSYQAIKHSLVEVLRLRENAYSLLVYAGWAYEDSRDEFPLAASAARSAAGHALDVASRTMISIHGGTGATWEHDAPLFFRRAQLSRRLLGGVGDATDRVAGELLAAV